MLKYNQKQSLFVEVISHFNNYFNKEGIYKKTLFAGHF